jgi:hypothetical protein
MTTTLTDDIKKSAVQLLTRNNGINRSALFQTHNRKIKYPGNNLFFTVSKTSLSDSSGLNTTAPIHTDVRSAIDNDGNFPINNYIQSIVLNKITIQRIFNRYPENKPPVILNINSFLNRRLRAGMAISAIEEPIVVKQPISRLTLSNRLRPGLFSKSRTPLVIKSENEDEEED